MENYIHNIQKLIYLHLISDCFMMISAQTSEQIQEEKSS